MALLPVDQFNMQQADEFDPLLQEFPDEAEGNAYPVSELPEQGLPTETGEPDLSAIFAMMEDGGDDILTDEERKLIGLSEPPLDDSDFTLNLAELISKNELARIADQVVESFDDDEQSRKDWLEREAMGIRLLGVSENVEDGAEFDGASEVVHPLLMEAVLQFQSRALAEIWPPDGPCKTVVMGDLSREKEEQAKRVQDYINYSYTIEMQDAFTITDQMLFRLPMSGSAFIKLYWCPLKNRIVRQLVKPGDFVVPYHCDSLESAPRTTHVLRMIHNDVRKLQLSGFYMDVKLMEPADEDSQTNTTLRDEIDAADSRSKASWDYDSQRHVILEQTCYLKIDGIDDDEELYSPYIVHVEKEQNKVLAIYRNWEEGDPLRTPKQHVIHYKFLPGLGFYGFGLLHIMGGITRSATGALRALLDAAHFANLPGGYRSRDAQIRGKHTTVSPGEWLEVETTADELSKAFFPLPYKEPSPVLFNLLGLLDQLGRRIGGATEIMVGDANNNGPVGTTLALIEQGLKVMSAIHMRLHRSQQSELRLFADLCAESMPAEGYPYQVPGQDRTVMAQDFDERVDVIPVSDPNVVSATHRIALAQAQMDLANAHPDLFDMRVVCERLLQAMRVSDYEQIMPPQKEPPRADPVTEGTSLLTGKPVQAFQDQDHQAHIIVHQDLLERVPQFIGAAGTKQRSQTQTAIMAHISEHVALQTSLMYQQAMGQQIPQGEQIQPEVENQIAALAAQAAQMMPKPEAPDPNEAQAAQQAMQAEQSRIKSEMDGEKTRADIRRKDAIAASDLDRKNAALTAELNRNASKHEAELLTKFISENAKNSLAVEPPDEGLPLDGFQP